jgi:hypothetical protein
MNYGRFHELAWEFDEFFFSLQTLYLDSIAGFNILHQHLLDHQKQFKILLGNCEEASDEFQDTCEVDYKRLSGDDFRVRSSLPEMKQGKVKERTARNGTNHILIGRLCVAHAFDFWEDYLRKQVKEALGGIVLPKHDLWGDLCRMRNAIVHSRGIAGHEFEKMKVLKWFKPGDPIDLDFDKMNTIFDHMANFRNSLRFLSLPPSKGRFPSKDT